MRQSIGDFAENLIRSQSMGQSVQQNQYPTSSRPQRTTKPSSGDISNVHVSNDVIGSIMEESFGVSTGEVEKAQPLSEGLLTESTAQELIESINSLKAMIQEVTSVGSIGATFSNTQKKTPPRTAKEVKEILRKLGYDV